MDALKAQTTDVFHQLLYHKAPDLFPECRRHPSSAAYVKVIQWVDAISAEEEYGKIIDSFMANVPSARDGLKRVLEKVLQERRLHWGRLVTAMSFAVDVCVNSHERYEGSTDTISTELATLICDYVGNWLLRQRGWDGSLDRRRHDKHPSVVQCLCWLLTAHVCIIVTSILH